MSCHGCNTSEDQHSKMSHSVLSITCIDKNMSISSWIKPEWYQQAQYKASWSQPRIPTHFTQPPSPLSSLPSSVWRATKAVVKLVSWHVSAHGCCKHCHDELFNKEKTKSFGVVQETSDLYTVACYQHLFWFDSLGIIL